MRLKLLDELDADDPILSIVNLIDVFLVIIAALLLSSARQPGLVVQDGPQIQRLQPDGAAAQGKGVRAGVAYRMADGSLVFVPE